MSENAVKTVKGILLTVLAFMSTMVMSQQAFGATNAQVQAFIKDNRAAVMAVSNEYGIYPSIQMAQAALESGWGTSQLSTKANNYFGVKWGGSGAYVAMPTQEYVNGHYITVTEKFAKYNSVRESLEGNARLLANGLSWNHNYYSGAWRSKASNYKEAAYGLQGKYATAPDYAAKLIRVIETYHLQEMDGGYINDGTGWFWYENGQKFTGFRFYMGTYYWFENGARINNAWRSAWGYRYYVDGEGRAVQGLRTIGGKRYHFGTDGTFYLRTNQTVAHNQEKYRASSNGELQPWSGYFDTPAGWRWIENGQMYTGFRFYMGAYYYFRNGVRQHNQFVSQWGLHYYVGHDGRSVQGIHVIDGKRYNFGSNGTFYMRWILQMR